MLLVEAPPDAIVACMADLNRDAANFSSVAIDYRGGEAGAFKAVGDKLALPDLRMYSRGQVSPEQRDKLRKLSHFYAIISEGKEVDDLKIGTSAPNKSAPSQPESSIEEVSRLAIEEKKPADGQQLSRETSESVAGAAAAAGDLALRDETVASGRQQPAPQDRKDAGAAAAGKLKVLFVVSPEEEPAAGAPAAKQPE
jgi:hypothetical protein